MERLAFAVKEIHIARADAVFHGVKSIFAVDEECGVCKFICS
jgi:hypothetical protein